MCRISNVCQEHIQLKGQIRLESLMKWQFSFLWPKLLNQFWKANVIKKVFEEQCGAQTNEERAALGVYHSCDQKRGLSSERAVKAWFLKRKGKSAPNEGWLRFCSKADECLKDLHRSSQLCQDNKSTREWETSLCNTKTSECNKEASEYNKGAD